MARSRLTGGQRHKHRTAFAAGLVIGVALAAAWRRRQAARVRTPQRGAEAKPIPDQSAPLPGTLTPAEDGSKLVWVERRDTFKPRVDAPLATQQVDEYLFASEGGTVVRFAHGAIATIWAHTQSDTRFEQGGILLGQVTLDRRTDVYTTVVREALPAAAARVTRVHFQLTPESWAGFSARLRGIPDDWTVIGAFHSHPGFGVFLSGEDMHTQRSFLREPWQIAVVVDPIRSEIGVFAGAAGEPCGEIASTRNANRFPAARSRRRNGEPRRTARIRRESGR